MYPGIPREDLTPKPQPQESVLLSGVCPICKQEADWLATSIGRGGTEYVITCPTETCLTLEP